MIPAALWLLLAVAWLVLGLGFEWFGARTSLFAIGICATAFVVEVKNIHKR